MPILYVHGVNVRSRAGFRSFEPLARRYLAPVISDDSESVVIDDVFWGELAFSPAFGGISRPRSKIFGMGVQESRKRDARIAHHGALSKGFEAALAAKLPQFEDDATQETSTSSQLGSSGSSDTDASSWAKESTALQDLGDDALSDVLSILVRPPTIDEEAFQILEADNRTLELEAQLEKLEEAKAQEAALAIAADMLVQNGEARGILQSSENDEAKLDELLSRIATLAADDSKLAAQGFLDWVQRTRDRILEGARRYDNLKGYLISAVLVEARAPIHNVVSRFLGDVFVYLNERGEKDAPGAIPRLLLEKLEEMHAVKEKTGEPLVVVTHSMGGQLMYDAVSHYLPKTAELAHIQVDLWCAAASQVGFFEEGKLFHASTPEFSLGKPVPFPENNLGAWWNVWDPNDVLSFTANNIFQGVDDESYSSGSSLIAAHGAYLETPSFHRKLAEKARTAIARTG